MREYPSRLSGRTKIIQAFISPVGQSLKSGGIRRVTSRGKLLRRTRSDFLRLERDYRAAAARREN
jgi:hypothetical protein